MSINRTYVGVAMLILGAGMTVTSCKKKKDVVTIPEYTVPATYSFENVEYTEASGRVSMWAGLTSYLGKSSSRKISQDTTNNLWNNTNSSFTAEISTNLPHSTSALNGFSFNISGKVSDAGTIKQYIDSMVAISQFYTATASQGVPGKIGTRIVNYSGLEFNQLVAKGLMGALQMNQVITYLDKAAKDDNSTVTAGSGTAMQHDWDLAFGYVGLPTDYDSSKTYASTEANRPLAIGGYFRERGQYIKSGGIVFEAFRKGRAAINNKDYTKRDSAIATIKLNMEKILAAAAYAYMGLSQGSSDLATRFHALSEGAGFVLALKFRPSNSQLTAANYLTLQEIAQTNFYVLIADASNTKVKQAQTILSTAYGQLQP
ncbi:MAG: hypothetical protein JWQ38_3748 [Flavipsychrobacter sp.]|nr:hypothetical protein [Flavipsychrobacter sp.]